MVSIAYSRSEVPDLDAVMLEKFRGFGIRPERKHNPGRDEIVRFFNALFIHKDSSSRLLDALNGFVYRGSLCRSEMWPRNRTHFLNSYIKDRLSFLDSINHVKA